MTHTPSPAAAMRLLGAVLAASMLHAAAAHAQRPQFSPTLFWDSGLINTPAAYVSPLGGDIAVNYTAMKFDSSKGPGAFDASRATTRYVFSLSASIYGRAEVGITVFESDLRNGLFAKALIWDQTDGIWRTGLLHYLPSFAVGVRNLGSESGADRFGDTRTSGLNTSGTLYAVATRTIVLASGDGEPGAPSDIGARPKAQLALSAGMGNGLFKNDGGFGKQYANSSTGGVFGGAQLQFATSRYSTLSLIAEHDGWDMNVGAQFDLRGLRANIYMTELGAGAGKPGSLAYQKFAMSLGWQTNLSALLPGNRMERVTEAYARTAEQLRTQIAAGEARVKSLDTQLKTMQTTQQTDASAQRAELERQLKEEQDAVKRLQELLKAREAQKKP